MLFASLIFIFWFLPVVIAVYFLLKNEYRNIWLMLASLFFYAWGETKYFILLLISLLANYVFGILLGKSKSDINSKLILIGSLVFNFGALIYYKYWGFLIENLSTGLPSLNLAKPDIRLPIGISFFTFQIVSYIVDIYRKKEKPLHNIFDLTLYITFFPQLIAGPIISYGQISDQLKNRQTTLDDFSQGIQRFIFGLAKKVLIANNAALVADSIFALNPNTLSFNIAWLGIIAYALQIYFDFSGYSDMALGLSKIFGFHFPENFNYPYVATSIQDFWRRWHISLSSWFRDYVYIPLGGNKVAEWRIYLNLTIVFALTGIWHGANWTFLVWGLFNGFFLILERLFLAKFLKNVPQVFRHIYVFFVVIIGWVFFRSDNFSKAIQYLSTMFDFSADNLKWVFLENFANNEQLFFMFIGLVLSIPIYKKMDELYQKLISNTTVSATVAAIVYNTAIKSMVLFLFMVSVAYLLIGSYNPFIYFRF